MGYISAEVTCLHGLRVYASHLFTRVRYIYVDYIFAWVPYLHELRVYTSYLLMWGTYLQYIGCMLISITCFFPARKLQKTEFPHNLYIQNYNTTTATCILLRRWFFSPAIEKKLCFNEQALNFLYWQVGHFIVDKIWLMSVFFVDRGLDSWAEKCGFIKPRF